MKDHILLRKYINEALRDNIESFETDQNKEKEFFKKVKAKNIFDFKSTDTTSRKESFDTNIIDSRFEKYLKSDEFKNKIKNFEDTERSNLENNYFYSYHLKNNTPGIEDAIKSEIEKKKKDYIDLEKRKFRIENLQKISYDDTDKIENEEKIVNAFKNKFSNTLSHEKFKGRLANYEDITFKLFTLPTHINLMNLFNKIININNITKENFLIIQNETNDPTIFSERLYVLDNNEKKFKQLIDGLIKFQLTLNSNKEIKNKNELSFFEKMSIGFKQLIRNATDNKNEELFEIISLLQKIHNNIKNNKQDCNIIVYGISNVDDISSNNTDQLLTRSPWMTVHRIFDNYINSEFFQESIGIYEKYKQEFSDFFKKLSFKGFKIYINLLRENNFKFNFDSEKCILNVDIQDETEKDRFEKFNKKVLDNISQYPPIPKIKKNGIYNRYVSPINLNNSSPADINNFTPDIGYYTCIFKFQNIKSDFHMINRNADFVNEIMTYLLGILKNKKNGIYNIISKPKGKDPIQKSLNIEDLIDHIFLTDLTNFMKKEFNNEYSQFKKDILIPMITDIINHMDKNLEFYKGKTILIGK